MLFNISFHVHFKPGFHLRDKNKYGCGSTIFGYLFLFLFFSFLFFSFSCCHNEYYASFCVKRFDSKDSFRFSFLDALFSFTLTFYLICLNVSVKALASQRKTLVHTLEETLVYQLMSQQKKGRKLIQGGYVIGLLMATAFKVC